MSLLLQSLFRLSDTCQLRLITGFQDLKYQDCKGFEGKYVVNQGTAVHSYALICDAEKLKLSPCKHKGVVAKALKHLNIYKWGTFFSHSY